MAFYELRQYTVRPGKMAEFIACMERWAEAFVPNNESPVPGMTPEDWASLKMPVLIFRGSEKDLYHHRRITDWAARLIPHAKSIELPWSDAEFVASFTDGGSPLREWHRLAPAIAEFTKG